PRFLYVVCCAALVRRSICNASGAPRALHSFPTRRSSDLQGGPDPLARLSWRDEIDRVRRALSTLPDRQQQVLLLTRVEGMSTREDRKSTRLNSSHVKISYAVFCLKKKNRMLNDGNDTYKT